MTTFSNNKVNLLRENQLLCFFKATYGANFASYGIKLAAASTVTLDMYKSYV